MSATTRSEAYHTGHELRDHVGRLWQNIETAPKHGTRVLLFVPRFLGVCIGYWKTNADGGWWSTGVVEVGPTHWQPLPAYPIPLPPEPSTEMPEAT